MDISKQNFLQSAVLSVKKRFGLDIGLEKLTVIIGDKMDHEWKEIHYKDASPYMDTYPCEQVVELIAKHYLGRSWPTYGDKINFDDFWNELQAKMSA